MAQTEKTSKGSLGIQIAGIILAAAALACFVVGIYFHGKPEAWGGRETGLMLAAALCGVIVAVLGAKPLQAYLQPAEGAAAPPAWQPAVGLSALVLGGGCLAFMLANRVISSAWGKADTVVLIGGLIGLVIAAMIWWEPLQRGLSARGTMLQINAGVMTLLVLGILFLINYKVIPNHFGNIKADLTAKKYYSLSDQTKNVAKKVTKDNPIEILGVMAQDQYGGQDSFTFKKRLEDYGRLSPHIETKVLDPKIDLEGRKLIQEGTLIGSSGVVVRYKNDPTNAEGVSGTEEADITKGMLKLLEPSSKKVYFITGHGELTPSATDAMNPTQIFKQLMEADRFELADLALFSAAEIPADAGAVVVANPQQPFGAEELAKLEKYLAGGGRLLLLLDPRSKSNLGELAAKYGIEFHPVSAIDPMQAMLGQGGVVVSQSFGDHPITNFFKKYMVILFDAGYLTKAADLAGAEVTDLVKSSAEAYAQAAPAPGAAANAMPERQAGPLTFAMVATKPVDDGQPEPEKPADEAKDDKAKDEDKKPETRLVVIADGDFLNDSWYQNGAANSPMAADMIAWLADRTEVLGIPAKIPADEAQARAINLTDAQRKWMAVLTLLLPMLLVVVAGAVVKLARR